MRLSEALGIYQIDMLKDICKNISTDYFPADRKSYFQDKILEKIKNNFNEVAKRMEKNFKENYNITDFISIIIGDKAILKVNKNIQDDLEKWGIAYKGIEIFEDVREKFVEYYRNKLTFENVEEKNNIAEYPIYLKCILFLYDIYISSYGEIDNKKSIIENLKEKVKSENADIITDYLSYKRSEKNLEPYVNESIIESMKSEKLLLEFIISLYEKMLYKGYKDDLEKLASIQLHNHKWIKFEQYNIIAEEKREQLEDLGLLKAITLKDLTRGISLTEVGLSIVSNKFIDNWSSSKYRIEDVEKLIIVNNDNIYTIAKRLFDRDYNLEVRDVVLVFTKNKG